MRHGATCPRSLAAGPWPRLLPPEQVRYEIAEVLVLSERTVDAHVEHIRGKLGIRSRAAIAAWVTCSS